MKGVRLALAGLAAACAAACQGSEQPPGGTPSPTLAANTAEAWPTPQAIQACDLLTTDEIADVIGERVAEGEPFAFDDGAITFELCNWLTADEPLRVVAIGVGAQHAVTGDATVAELFDQQQGSAGDPEELSEVGDAAYVDHLGLWVLAGPYIMMVDIRGQDPASIDQLGTLAEAVLARL